MENQKVQSRSNQLRGTYQGILKKKSFPRASKPTVLMCKCVSFLGQNSLQIQALWCFLFLSAYALKMAMAINTTGNRLRGFDECN